MGRIRTAALVTIAVVVAVACGAGGPAPVAVQAPPPKLVAASPPARGLVIPAAVVPLGYRLTLELHPDYSGFRGEVIIDVELAAPLERIWLDARGLVFEQAWLEQAGHRRPVEVGRASRQRVAVELGSPVAGKATITLVYRGSTSEHASDGLFRRKVGGRWYLFSHLETVAARAAVPCFDEPRWKVPWDVTLVVPDGLVAASNMPETAREPRGDRVAIRFARTPPMPSYLLAVAVGPFDVVDLPPLGRAGIPGRLLVPAGRAADAAMAAAELPRVVAAVEDYLDAPVPVAKLDGVAVPHFRVAMENLGLVTYPTDWLLARPADATALRPYVRSVVAHEVAHHWFGNLVTPAWWDDAWLNEAFATWLAAKVSRELEPPLDPVADRAQTRRWVMDADRRPEARAIRVTVDGDAAADAAFHPLVYEKGALVLDMFEHAVGADRFRVLVRGYLAAHAGGNATTADFQAALATVDATAASALPAYLDHAGVPRLELALDCERAPAVVATATRATAAGPLAPRPPAWQVPLCVRFPDSTRGGGLAERCGWVTGASARLVLGVATCPDWVAANPDGTGYYQVAPAPALAEALQRHLSSVPPAARSILVEGVLGELSGLRTTASSALAWADRLLATGDAAAALDALGAIDPLIGPDLRPRWRAWLRARLATHARAGLRGPSGEPEEAARVRRGLLSYASSDPGLVGQAEGAARAWLAGGGALAGEDLGLALRIAARAGSPGIVDQLAARLLASRAAAERWLLLSALGAVEDPAALDRVLALALGRELPPHEAVQLLATLLAGPVAHERAWAALRQAATATAPRSPPFDLAPMLPWPGALCTDAHAAELAARLDGTAMRASHHGLTVADLTRDIRACARRRAHHAADLAASLPPAP